MADKEVACTVHRLVPDVALIADGRVAMVRYQNADRYDGQTGWFLPDDFLMHEEHPDRAASRILKEQLSAILRGPRLGFVESFGNGGWHLIFHYRVDVPRRPAIKAGKNVAALEWFDLRKFPPAGGQPLPSGGRPRLRRLPRVT